MNHHTTHHDWTEATSVSTSVVLAVAAATDQEPLEVSPLHEVLDPGALDSLFDPVGRENGTGTGTLSFHHEHCLVTVDADGKITVEPDDGQP